MAAPTAAFTMQRTFTDAYRFTEADESEEVLDFLAQHLPHTVVMSGLVRDNGLVNSANRGSFYGYRDEAGRLIGVALIGHATFIDTRDDAALAAFAAIAQRTESIHMILGEEKLVRRFWANYDNGFRQPRLRLTELLFEQTDSDESGDPRPSLRLATLDDLDLIVPIHAQLALAESGINPMDVDAAGFRDRCAQRIVKGRVWVWIEDSTLIFKADIASALAESTYLEGLYIAPQLRRRGYGLRCLTAMGNILLRNTKALHVLVNEQNEAALALLQRAGYRLRDRYETIFLQRHEPS